MTEARVQALPIAIRAQLFAHLAAMEQAGVPVSRAFASLQLPASAAARLAPMQRQLEQGRDLASAGQRSGLFNALEVSLLQAAQSAGSPARLYQQLATQYTQQARHAQTLRTRLLLPAGVLLLALLVQPLPELVGGSLSLFAYLWGILQPLLGLALLGWCGRKSWMRQPQPRAGKDQALDGLLLRFPLFGAALARRNSRDFFASLGLLLEAGVPMFEALPKALSCISNSQLRTAFQALSLRVQGGESLAKSIQSSAVPDRAQLANLVTSGESSGTLPAVLLAYAERESQALASFEEQLASWLPRLAYVLVAIWIVYGLLNGNGLAPTLPVELR